MGRISLLATFGLRVVAKLGQSGPSTQYCLKWAEYHYWPLLAKLGRVRVLAKLGQNGPIQSRRGFKYQPQNIFFCMSVQSSKKNRVLAFEMIFFSWRVSFFCRGGGHFFSPGHTKILKSEVDLIQLLANQIAQILKSEVDLIQLLANQIAQIGD